MEGMRLDPISGELEIDACDDVNDEHLNECDPNDDNILAESDQLFGGVDFSDDIMPDESVQPIEDTVNKTNIDIELEPNQIQLMLPLEPEPIKQEHALTIDGTILDGIVPSPPVQHKAEQNERPNRNSVQLGLSAADSQTYSKSDAVAAQAIVSVAPDAAIADALASDEQTRLNPSKWMCFVCKKEFKNLRKLNRHKKIHIDEKPFQCSKCNKGFIERTDLNRHLMRHYRTEQAEESTSKFNCNCCHAGFNFETDLKIHSSIHRDDGKIVCFGCDKEFLSEY